MAKEERLLVMLTPKSSHQLMITGYSSFKLTLLGGNTVLLSFPSSEEMLCVIENQYLFTACFYSVEP